MIFRRHIHDAALAAALLLTGAGGIVAYADAQPNSITLAGNSLTSQSLPWSTYNGADAPEGAYMLYLNAGVTESSATLTLPRTLQPGTYYFLVRGYNYDHPNHVRFAIGGGTGSVATDDRDFNTTWSNAVPVTLTAASNQLTLTVQKDEAASVATRFLFSGLHISTDPHVAVLRDNTIISLNDQFTPDATPGLPGNLIENGSFEVGLGHGWGLSQNRKVPLASVWDGGAGRTGSASVKLPLDTSARLYGPEISLISKLRRVEPNKQYTLSAWVKSESGAPASGVISLINAYGSPLGPPPGFPAQARVDQAFTAGPAWTRVQVTGYLPAYPTAEYRAQITGHNQAGRNLWVDDIALTAGDQPPEFQPAAPVEVGLQGSQPGNVYYDNAPLAFTARLSGQAGTDRAGALLYEVFDYRNRKVVSGSQPVVVAGGTTAAATITPAITGYGSFRLVAWVDGAPGSKDELTFSRVSPPTVSGLDLAGSLGTHSQFLDFQYDALRRVGVTWDRVLSPAAFFRWSAVEPADDQFVWYNTELDRAAAANIAVLGTIGTNNYWPSWADQGGLPNLDKWQEFVGQVASHYQGKVHAWEIWNEPQSTFTPAFYAQMLKRATDAIEAADPGATVVGMGGVAAPAYMQSVIDELVSQYPGWDWQSHIDVLSMHMYPQAETAGTNSPGTAQSFQDQIGNTYPLPIWNTETGFWDKGFLHSDNGPFTLLGENIFPYLTSRQVTVAAPEAIEAVGQTYLESIGNGGRKYFYYDSRIIASPDYPQTHPTVWEYDDTLRPKLIALSALDRKVGRAEGRGPLTTNDAAARALLFDRAGTPLVALYSLDNQNKQIALAGLSAGQITVYDIMGNLVPSGTTVPFGREPLLVEAAGLTVGQLRAAVEAGTVSDRNDTEDPIVSVDEGPVGAIQSGTPVRLRWTATDDRSLPSPYATDSLLYSYRIGSPQSAWSAWAPFTVADFAALADGPYTFEVKARDADGNESDPAAWSFTVGAAGLPTPSPSPTASPAPPAPNPSLPSGGQPSGPAAAPGAVNDGLETGPGRWEPFAVPPVPPPTAPALTAVTPLPTATGFPTVSPAPEDITPPGAGRAAPKKGFLPLTGNDFLYSLLLGLAIGLAGAAYLIVRTRKA